MKRKKAEPCEYCDGDMIQMHGEADDDRLVLELYPGNMVAASAILYNPSDEETFEDSVSIPMNFCPVCGRDLRM